MARITSSSWEQEEESECDAVDGGVAGMWEGSLSTWTFCCSWLLVVALPLSFVAASVLAACAAACIFWRVSSVAGGDACCGCWLHSVETFGWIAAGWMRPACVCDGTPALFARVLLYIFRCFFLLLVGFSTKGDDWRWFVILITLMLVSLPLSDAVISHRTSRVLEYPLHFFFCIFFFALSSFLWGVMQTSHRLVSALAAVFDSSPCSRRPLLLDYSLRPQRTVCHFVTPHVTDNTWDGEKTICDSAVR